jgi:ribosomal protein L28
MATKMTDRKPLFGNNRSHAMNATRKKQSLNMQQVTLSNGDKVMTTVREAKKI